MFTKISIINKYPLMKIEKGFVPVVYDNNEAIYIPSNGEDRHSIESKIPNNKCWYPYHTYNKNGSLEELGAMHSMLQKKYLEKYPNGFHIYEDKDGAIADLEDYITSADIEPKIAEVNFTSILAFGYRYIYIPKIDAFKGAPFSVALMIKVVEVEDVKL